MKKTKIYSWRNIKAWIFFRESWIHVKTNSPWTEDSKTKRPIKLRIQICKVDSSLVGPDLTVWNKPNSVTREKLRETNGESIFCANLTKIFRENNTIYVTLIWEKIADEKRQPWKNCFHADLTRNCHFISKILHICNQISITKLIRIQFHKWIHCGIIFQCG